MNRIILIFAFLLVFVSCSEGPQDETPSSNPSTPSTPVTPAPVAPVVDDYPDNPIVSANQVIKDMIDFTNFPINISGEAPNIEGTYDVWAQIVDSSDPQYVGEILDAMLTLQNQTEDGRIEYREYIDGKIVGGAGNYYIEGSGDSFTVTAIAITEIANSSCVFQDAILVSGYKLSNGNLQVEALYVNISKTNCDGHSIVDFHELNGTMNLR